MKRLKVCALALVLGVPALQIAHGAAAGFGFSMNGNFYSPSDSRYNGIGTGVGINIKFDDSLSLGYRVEELNVRYEQSGTSAGGVAGTNASANYSVISQGLTGYYRTWGSERLGVDFGLWLGAATTSNFREGGAFSLTSPFVEPMGRVVYSSAGKVEAQLTLGVGYRFVRRFTMVDDPAVVGDIGGTPSATLGDEAGLKNFDGLDIYFGVGVSF